MAINFSFYGNKIEDVDKPKKLKLIKQAGYLPDKKFINVYKPSKI